MERLPKRRIWIAAIAVTLVVIAFSSSGMAARVFERTVSGSYRLATSRTGGGVVFDNFHFIFEKGTHLTMYFVLGFLLSGFYANKLERRWLFTLGTGFAVGISSELLQFAFPGRDPAVRDVLINFAGTTMGALAFALVRPAQSSHSHE
jgi:VanZ family protein